MSPTSATVSRVTSHDGTDIGYFSSGDGPPLLLVHGGLGDHTRWDVLRPYLEPHVTVHAMDRRGRGASGDSPDYTIEREYEDVAAVVDGVAEASGSPVDVYCSSFTIPHAQLELLPAGHGPWLGHPDRVAAVVRDFVR